MFWCGDGTGWRCVTSRARRTCRSFLVKSDWISAMSRGITWPRGVGAGQAMGDWARCSASSVQGMALLILDLRLRPDGNRPHCAQPCARQPPAPGLNCSRMPTTNTSAVCVSPSGSQHDSMEPAIRLRNNRGRGVRGTAQHASAAAGGKPDVTCRHGDNFGVLHPLRALWTGFTVGSNRIAAAIWTLSRIVGCLDITFGSGPCAAPPLERRSISWSLTSMHSLVTLLAIHAHRARLSCRCSTRTTA